MAEAKRQATIPAPNEYLREPARLKGFSDRLGDVVDEVRLLLDREDPPSEEEAAAARIEIEKARALARPVCRTLRRLYLRRGIIPFFWGAAAAFVLTGGEDLIHRGDFSPLRPAVETARAWLASAVSAVGSALYVAIRVGAWIVATGLWLCVVGAVLCRGAVLCARAGLVVSRSAIAGVQGVAARSRARGWVFASLFSPRRHSGAQT